MNNHFSELTKEVYIISVSQGDQTIRADELREIQKSSCLLYKIQQFKDFQQIKLRGSYTLCINAIKIPVESQLLKLLSNIHQQKTMAKHIIKDPISLVRNIFNIF